MFFFNIFATIFVLFVIAELFLESLVHLNKFSITLQGMS